MRRFQMFTMLLAVCLAGSFQLSAAAEELPKEVRDLIKKAMKDAGKGDGPAIQVSGKAYIIGPDGKKREIKFGDREGKATVGGKVTVIGPDGKRKVTEFGGEGMDLRKALSGLPEEVRKAVEKKIKDQTGKGGVKPKISTRGKIIVIGPDGKQKVTEFGDGKGSLKGIVEKITIRRPKATEKGPKLGDGDKLDLILDRLERMEKELQQLKKKVG